MCLILQKGITQQYATSLQACQLCATVDDFSMGSVLNSVTFTRQGNSSHQCASAPSSQRSNWPLPRKFVPHTAELALDLQCCILGLIHHILQAIALWQARNGRNSR